MNPQQELQSIEQYYTAFFIDSNFSDLELPPLTRLPFDRQDVLTELLNLPSTKALAPDGLPALIWRHFAHDLVDPLMHQIIRVWLNHPIELPTHWTTGWIHLLPKPNKSPNKPQALRQPFDPFACSIRSTRSLQGSNTSRLYIKCLTDLNIFRYTRICLTEAHVNAFS